MLNSPKYLQARLKRCAKCDLTHYCVNIISHSIILQSLLCQHYWQLRLKSLTISKLYLEGFTNNVKDILNNFTHEDSDNGDLTRIYSRLDRAGLLFAVTQAFVTKADLRPEVVDNAMMGTAFETVIRWSKNPPTQWQDNSTHPKT